MKIIDEIYGEEEIDESVLIELFNSPSLLRLKGISAQGPPQRFWSHPVSNRYEHSIGVFMLLRKKGASLEEQIAGLLHDISHTAFSHIIDWVFGDPQKENYQDSLHSERMEKSEINKILKKYGFDYERVSNFHNFLLLDNEIPSICADRLDYSLRELKLIIGIEKTRQMFLALVVINGSFAFNSISLAKEFSLDFLDRQKNHWAAEESRKKYFLFARIFKYALEKHILVNSDFWLDDEQVLSKLVGSKDIFILESLKLLESKNFLRDFNEEGFVLRKKLRYVDPFVFFNDNLTRLSELDKDYKQKLEEFLKNAN